MGIVFVIMKKKSTNRAEEIDLVTRSQKLVYLSSYAKIATHHYKLYYPEHFDKDIWILNESRFNVVWLIVC